MADEVQTTPDAPVPPSKAVDAFPGAPEGRDFPAGTAERVSIAGQELPMSNAQARNLGAKAIAETPGLTDELDAVRERLRRVSLAEGGQEPDSYEVHVNVAQTVAAGEAPKTFYGMSSTYVFGERDFFASSVGQFITSYTLDSSTISADANGDKIVFEGTVMAASGAKLQPRTGGMVAVGLNRHRVNARYGDQDIGLVIGGRIRPDKCWDNGAFGSIAAGAQTSLNAMGIFFQTFDI